MRAGFERDCLEGSRSSHLLAVGDDILELNTGLHWCPGVEAEAGREGGGSHPGLRVGLEQTPIEIVGDLSAVLHLSHLVGEQT